MGNKIPIFLANDVYQASLLTSQTILSFGLQLLTLLSFDDLLCLPPLPLLSNIRADELVLTGKKLKEAYPISTYRDNRSCLLTRHSQLDSG